MKTELITESDLIYEAEIQFTKTVEYGVSMADISTGNIPYPLEGARFDQSFLGSLHGPVLCGRISGIDHLFVTADGRFQLHIHAQINTDDGHNISFSSEGVSIQNEGTDETRLRAAVSLFSSSPAYRWLNRLQIWVMGTLDLQAGKAFVKAYAV